MLMLYISNSQIEDVHYYDEYIQVSTYNAHHHIHLMQPFRMKPIYSKHIVQISEAIGFELIV